MNFNKKGTEEFLSKNVIYWILIAAFAIIMFFLIKGIINKLLVLY